MTGRPGRKLGAMLTAIPPAPQMALSSVTRVFDIKRGELQDPRVQALLREHLAALRATSPPESCHPLDTSELSAPGVTFWCAWDGEALAGFGALKRLTSEHVEIKSMRTASTHLRRGVAAAMLRHLLDQAIVAGYLRVSLETGSQDYFLPAHRLYRSFGFEECGPFGQYRMDPLSAFMTRTLARRAPR